MYFVRASLFLGWLIASIGALESRPWLDKTLPVEERLRTFIAQLNSTQKLNMVQGDTEVELHDSLPTLNIVTDETVAYR